MLVIMWWRIYWGLFILIGFCVPETFLLITKRAQYTLSDTVWWAARVKGGMQVWHWSVIHLFLLAFMIWLTGHFVFRIWR